ncbi:hypothetical protein D3C75_712480 [compost metagenome]
MGVAAVVIIAQAGVAEQVVRAGPVQVEFLRVLGDAEFIVAVPCGHAAVLAFQPDDAALCITQIKEGLRHSRHSASSAGSGGRLPIVALVSAYRITHADPFFARSVYIGLLPVLSGGPSCGQRLRNTHSDVIGKINIELPLLILWLPAIPVTSRIAGQVCILNRTVTNSGPHADPVAVTVILVRSDVAVRISVSNQAVRGIPAVALQHLRACGQCSFQEYFWIQDFVCPVDLFCDAGFQLRIRQGR